VTTTFTIAGDGSVNKTLHTKPSAAFPKLSHELIDQLSIISFCRFKISETFACDLKKSTKDFEALEDAVQEAARLDRRDNRYSLKAKLFSRISSARSQTCRKSSAYH
jgi:hypothetical protein